MKAVCAVAVGGLLYVGERTAFTEGPPTKKMDHLVCFLPGLLALGHSHGIETGAVVLLPSASTATQRNRYDFEQVHGQLLCLSSCQDCL